VRRPAGLTLAAFATVLVLAPAAPPRAEPLPAGSMRDGEHGYQLTVGEGWRPVDTADTLLAYRSDDGDHLAAVSRLPVGRLAARGETALFQALERGVSSTTTGYHRIKRATSKHGVIPILDLTYRRDDPDGYTWVRLRFLCYRSFTLALTVTGKGDASHAQRRAVGHLVDSFQPFPISS
jgi:hypothetical protein